MKCLLNTEYAKLKSLEHPDVSAIMDIIEKAGQIQDGYFITDTVRIGNTRYVVGKKKENGQEQFCTCHTAEGSEYTDFRFHARWFDAVKDLLEQTTAAYDTVVREHNKQNFKPVICKDCGTKLTGINPLGDVYASSHYNGTEYCDSCMIEHCVHTNCLGCDRGTYPDCQFLAQKNFYLQEDDD